MLLPLRKGAAMYPVLFRLGPLTIHTYGVLVGVAILVSLLVATGEARRRGIPQGAVEGLLLPVLIGGFLGARLFYVVFWEPVLLWSDPLGLLAVWRGGLALQGGILGGLAAGLWYCLRKRIPLWSLADTLAPAIILGQAIGRLGCLASGDSYGRPTRLPWAITFTDPGALAPLGVPLHPVQLYEFALDLVLFFLLWGIRRRPTSPGSLFLLYAGGYGIIRFATEAFRGDRLELLFGLSLLQALSLAMLIAALFAVALRHRGVGLTQG